MYMAWLTPVCFQTGKAFDTTQPVNYAVSNIISAIVYGSRFDYNDSRFIGMVNRANENIRLGGSPTVQVSHYSHSEFEQSRLTC